MNKRDTYHCRVPRLTLQEKEELRQRILIGISLAEKDGAS